MSFRFLSSMLAASALLTSLPVVAAPNTPVSRPVESRVNEVTAYQGLAQVKRSVVVSSSTTGSRRVRIAGLPLRLNRDSLNIEGKGAAGVSLQHFQLVSPESYDKPVLTPREKELEAAVKNLKERLDQLKTREELNRVHRDFMRLFAQQIKEAPEDEDERSIRAWQQALDFTLKQQKEILTTRESIGDLKAPLQKEYRRLSQALREYRKHHPQTQEVDVQLYFKTPGSVTLTLSYLIPNVSWSPMYEARLDNDTLDLRYGSEVMQQSGENWDNVNLKLSTATPLLNQAAPEPYQWSVGGYSLNEGRTRSRRELPSPKAMSNMMPAPAPVMEDAVAEQEMDRFQSQVSDHGIALEFNLPGKQSLGSSNHTRQLTMVNRQVKVDTSYKIIPRQSTQAFLEVNLTNTTGLPLLPGKMRSYVQGSFTGVQPVELIRPEQEARLSFGVDRNIKVKWLELDRKDSPVNVLNNKKQTTITYQAEVTNYKKEAAKIRVLEPRPVSQNDAIKIEWVKGEPEASQVTDEKLRIWELTAKPWEKKVIKMTYRVTYPGDMKIRL